MLLNTRSNCTVIKDQLDNIIYFEKHKLTCNDPEFAQAVLPALGNGSRLADVLRRLQQREEEPAQHGVADDQEHQAGRGEEQLEQVTAAAPETAARLGGQRSGGLGTHLRSTTRTTHSAQASEFGGIRLIVNGAVQLRRLRLLGLNRLLNVGHDRSVFNGI